MKVYDIPAEEAPMKLLMPAMKWRFQALVGSDYSKVFTRQVVSCNIDYIQDHLEFVIRQPTNDATLHDLIFDMCKYSSQIYVQEMSALGKPLTTLSFTGRAIKHSFELSYGESEVAVHKLTIKFERMSASSYEPEPEAAPAPAPKKKRVAKKTSK